MNDSAPDPARHKAVLAAVLAVQRGFLSPDEAVRVLAELKPEAGAQAVQTLLSVTPTTARAAISAEVESLAEKPEVLAATLSEMGVNEEAQSTLFALKPNTSSEAATKALSSLAERRRRVADMTARLPSSSATGRYQVKREFARGGMGLIWVAVDSAVGREVALKELLPPKLGSGTSKVTDSPEIVERFLREAKVTGQLEHPNIVPVYEIATRDDGSVFYTMKLVRGKTLAHRLLQIANGTGSRQEKLAQRLKLLDAFNDVCNAIAYAHSRGVIHRDIKPANIMLGDFGETLVLDWGLARVQGQEDSTGMRRKAEEQAFSPSLLQDDSENRTLDGAVLGTPAYMPPEQARGELDKVDERADVYALGAILYEILAGRPPYAGTSARDVLAKVLVLEPEPLATAAPNAPPDLVSLAQKAMARDPSARLQTAEKLGAEVLAFRDGRQLSVYRYSKRELFARFVSRNKAAVSVAVIALVLIVSGAAYAFDNIAEKRDIAEQSLQAADRERDARMAAEKKRQQERDQLIQLREAQIDGRRDRLDELHPDTLLEEAVNRISEMRRRGEVAGGLTPADRAENARIVQGLLNVATMQQDLLDMFTDPVAGEIHQFVPADTYQAELVKLVELRTQAALLAEQNQDFAMAEFIVRGTALDKTRSADLLRQIDAGRNALLKRHADAIQAALSELAGDIGVHQPGVFKVALEDFVLQLSAYREPQTVTLLGDALKPSIERAAASDEALFWTQAERDVITMICRVLAHLELPSQTVPVLASFMRVVDDNRLAIECGTALCLTGSADAWQPLVDARSRFGKSSYVWVQIAGRVDKVPMPTKLPPAVTADELIERAELRRAFGQKEGVAEDIDAALALEPDNPVALVAKGTWLRESVGTAGGAPLAQFERALQVDADNASAWSEKSWELFKLERPGEALTCADKAIELDDDNWRYVARRAYMHMDARRYRDAERDYNRAIKLFPWYAALYSNLAAIHVQTGEYDKALADCNHAIDLDPRQNEAWINRGVVKFELGDLDGSVADLTRLLELAPGHPWGYINRGKARLKLKQYEGAVDDFGQALAKYPAELCIAYYMRAEAQIELGHKQAAVADLKEFLKYETTGETADKARAMLKELEQD